jgi:hypothetical protein
MMAITKVERQDFGFVILKRYNAPSIIIKIMTSSNNNTEEGGGNPQPAPITKQNNKEQTQNIIQQHNNKVTKQGKHDDDKKVTEFSKVAAAIERVLKTFQYPTDTNRIIEYVQFQSSTPESHEILPILQKIEEKQFGNVSDVIKAAEKVAYK